MYDSSILAALAVSQLGLSPDPTLVERAQADPLQVSSPEVARGRRTAGL